MLVPVRHDPQALGTPLTSACLPPQPDELDFAHSIKYPCDNRTTLLCESSLSIHARSTCHLECRHPNFRLGRVASSDVARLHAHVEHMPMHPGSAGRGWHFASTVWTAVWTHCAPLTTLIVLSSASWLEPGANTSYPRTACIHASVPWNVDLLKLPTVYPTRVRRFRSSGSHVRKAR